MKIENEYLRVEAKEIGGELQSIYGKKEGVEYLWQGDPAYWTGRAYHLFPIIGRLHEGKYEVYGETYEMAPHGLVRKRPLEAKQIAEDEMSFALVSDESTLEAYPFPFVYTVHYRLTGKKLVQTISVENRGDRAMYFAIGGHPGFNIPFDGGVFEDYGVRFPCAGKVRQCTFTQNILMSGEKKEYPLTDKTLPLSHDLFGLDAVVLEGTGGKAIISKKGGKHSVCVEYPDMPYLGVWHKPQSDAPYVCLEPWSALPARDGVKEDFSKKSDMTKLEAGKTHTLVWSIEIG